MTQFCNSLLSQQDFLAQYWQKKPLLIRQAFPNFASPISPDELAGLACEDEVESRLIEEKGASGKWQVTRGPLSEKDFARLPETHWTMLVQDVDKHIPELQTLLDPLRFIPDWRRDDLMISYAPKFGSVGPHTDSYDVFLLQAMGTRQWQIMDQEIHEAVLIDGIELQILQEFNADQSWELQPGDMLYLPPHIAHHGVALDECMTFSFGFRAPKKIELLDAIVDSLLEKNLAKDMYADPDLQRVENSAEIEQQAVFRMKQMLHQAIDEAEPLLASALAKFVTITKPSLENLAAEYRTEAFTVDDLDRLFACGEQLQRNVYFRFAWIKEQEGGVLFMAGEAYPVDKDGVQFLPELTGSTSLNQQDWLLLKNNSSITKVMLQLIEEGGWFWLLDE
ncbi:MAG: cupin domain-containing protein [Methyloprofundus sp.]|nr:cupin domain-containing protein [Methyloprofundus sp.]